jgi:leader peptidase (prepilin peptidase) / N-methyltransferase
MTQGVPAFVPFTALLFGLVIGSFLNVVAWRLPRGESLVRPGSACPSCSTPVKPYDNVPVLSWLWLRGRCRACAAAISGRYPLVELATGLLWLVVALRGGPAADVVLGLVLVTVLVPLVLIDLDHRLLPNRITGPAAVAAAAIGAAMHPAGLPEQLVAGAAAGAFFLAAALARPGGMGMGDVKLAAVLGLFLGRAVAPALLVALVVGTLAGVVVMARKGVGDGRRTALPFGPFLALGGVVALLWGDALVDAYVQTF